MTTTVYLVGLPGSGKTTALRLAMAQRRWEHLTEERLPVRHQQWITPTGQLVARLGWPRPGDGLEGTDVLALDAQPKVLAWLAGATYAPAWLVGEGDRLATDGFLRAASSAGMLRLLWIDTPEREAERRAVARGAHQDTTWRQGRATKVAGLVRRWGPHRIDGLAPPEVVAAEVAQWLP